jgi:hypothetical protein
MKSLIALFLLSGCSSSAAPSPLVGHWFYDSGARHRIALDINADGTYAATTLQGTVASPTAAEAQVETGTYAATDTAVTWTPKQSTCPGPAPVSMIHYTFNGDALLVSNGTSVATYQRQNAQATQGFDVVLGCFLAQNGAFVAAPLAPVPN